MKERRHDKKDNESFLPRVLAGCATRAESRPEVSCPPAADPVDINQDPLIQPRSERAKKVEIDIGKRVGLPTYTATKLKTFKW